MLNTSAEAMLSKKIAEAAGHGRLFVDGHGVLFVKIDCVEINQRRKAPWY